MRALAPAACCRLLAAPLLAFAVAPATAESLDPASKLETVRKEIQEVQGWLQQARKQQGSLVNELRESESEIGRLGREQRKAERQLGTLRKEHQTAQRELRGLQQQIELQREGIRRQLRARYVNGRAGQLRLLLNQQQPDQVTRVARYYEYLQEARLSRIDHFLALAEQARAQEQRIASQRTAIEHGHRRNRERQAALDAQRQARLLTLSKLNEGIRSNDEQAQRLEKDRAHLEKLLEEVLQGMPELALERQQAPFSSRKGKLPWPAQGAVQATFGSSRAELHRNGVRIRGKQGGEVRAVHSGHVVFADWMRRFGLLIIIDHGHGFMSLYGHNESLLKRAGEWVSAGESVALLGNSGGQEENALYFELRQGGKPINPRKWLTRR